MGLFFIDVESGKVATQSQLIEAGIASEDQLPQRPWFQIDGTRDASTLWYAVMRKQERGIFIGALCVRHQGRHASLLDNGWEEVPIDQIGP